jgi:hypothetical protein
VAADGRAEPLAVLARQGKFCGRIEGTAATGFSVFVGVKELVK